MQHLPLQIQEAVPQDQIHKNASLKLLQLVIQEWEKLLLSKCLRMPSSQKVSNLQLEQILAIKKLESPQES